ncbi:MAGE-domain-containing protein [Xylariaceae sp. FL1019]|nr:MAGE-domain-containing protein [Xylariaceae sp. FL1019]
MPPQAQRRRRSGNDDDDRPPPPQRRQRRAPDSDDESAASSGNEQDPDVEMGATGLANGVSIEQLIQKLVRYALACEYARIPIRRDGIREKVLGTNARSFRRVFDGAQEQLQSVFGMKMVELPVKEKRTLREKTKAVKRGSKATASSRQYILTTTLPKAYTTHTIIGPSRIPSTSDEASYTAFYTTVITIISLSNGEISDAKLRRHLTRLNAAQHLPMDRTENVMAKLVRQGYLEKVVERVEGDEDIITWCVGPRGKTEVTSQNVAEFVSEVWRDPPEDFDTKLEKSLGVRRAARDRDAPDGEEEAEEEAEEAG